MKKSTRVDSKYIKGDTKKVNYTKDEFDELLKHNEGYFKNHVEKYENYYNLERRELKAFGASGQYNIPYLTAPLIKIMMENITENPYRNGRLVKVEDRKTKKERQKYYNNEEIKDEKKIILENGDGLDLDKIIKYNEVIIKDIENLPIDIKVNLKKSTVYEFNYVLNEVMPHILDRFSILFSLLISQSSVSAGNSYIDLINALDSWIRNFAIHSIDIEEYKDTIYREGIDSIEDLKNGKKSKLLNIGTDKIFNEEVDKSYIIDSILREEYYRNLELAQKFNDKVKNRGLIDFLEYVGYEGDSNNIDKSILRRSELLEWIEYTDKNNYKNIKEELDILENRLLNFKNRVKSIDKVKNGKMMRVNFYKDIMRSIVKSVSKDPILHRERIIDDLVGFIEPRELALYMRKHLKQIISLSSYKKATSMNIIDIDSDFDKDLEIYAIRLWEEYDCKDKKKEKKIEKLINGYYEKLRLEEKQISNIRVHLTKAVEEMIVPKLIDEINNL